MSIVLILLALSAITGFALGTFFRWVAILISGAAFAVFSSVVLHLVGFGALSGISTIAACLTVNQMAYLVGVASRRSSIHEQADDDPRDTRHGGVGRQNQQEQRAPSQIAR
jgi:hypothetical protein